MILDNGKLVTQSTEVAEIMNDFYINIASSIGTDDNMPCFNNYDCTFDFII